MAKEVSNKLVAALLVLVIVVSVLGTWFFVDQASDVSVGKGLPALAKAEPANNAVQQVTVSVPARQSVNVGVNEPK